MFQPARIARQAGRFALVDDIPFQMPVQGIKSSTILAAFPCDPVKARVLLQGNEVHPFVLWNKALLLVTVVDYRHTNIGKYIEFSIALACTHGARPAPRLLPALLRGLYGTGQWVYDLRYKGGDLFLIGVHRVELPAAQATPRAKQFAGTLKAIPPREQAPAYKYSVTVGNQRLDPIIIVDK